MQMRRVSVFCIMVLMSCIYLGCTAPSQEPDRYYNKSKGFSFRFPDGWKEQKPEGPNIVVQYGNLENTEQIGLQVVKKSPEQTVTGVTEYMHSFIPRQGGQVLADGETIIADCEANWMFSHQGNKKVLSHYFMKGDSLYTIIHIIDEDHYTDVREDEMREIAKSFRFEQ